MLLKSVSVAVAWLASTYLVLKMFRPLFSMAPMLKSLVATIMKRSKSSGKPKRASSQATLAINEFMACSVLFRSPARTNTCSRCSLPDLDTMRCSRATNLPATKANK